MHKLLRRQLRKLALTSEGLPADVESWETFVDTIDRSYVAGDQGRYLLERSLAISSDEMQLAYRRQAAIAECSQALLFTSDEKAIEPALETLLEATGALCAAVDVNVIHEGVPVRERRWERCTTGADHADTDVKPWDADPELHASLSAGRPFIAASEICISGADQCTVAYVPVAGSTGWIATLVVASASNVEWTKADLQLLQVGAEMLGTHMDQRSARDELERLSRSKDKFIASVSHELRTPLTVVVGLADELNERLPNFTFEESSELIAMILRQSRDVSNIVEDLLVAARASIGALTVASEEVKVHDEIRAFVIEGAGSDLNDIEFRTEPAIARADPARLRQILRNLVSNALRYGGTRIVVESAPSEWGVTVIVSDDGPGIPPELREIIFEPFTSAHGDATRPSAVGIGLTVSKELAVLMGGDLTYRYDEGHSVFELTLPLGGKS